MACILYAWGIWSPEVAEPKKEAAMEVLPNPDPQVGSEQRPFGPWMLPPNRRRKRNQPRGKPKNPGPQDSKYPEGEEAGGQTISLN